MNDILAVKVLSGTHTVDIMKDNCHYLEMTVITLDDPLTVIPGIVFKLNKLKSPIPIEELEQFIPMTAIVRIVYKEIKTEDANNNQEIKE